MSKKNLRTPKRKRGGSKALLIVLIVLLVLAIGGMIAYAVVDNMMGTAPAVDTNTPWQNDEANTPNATPVKREEGSYNFLVVGRDIVALNTDVMMIVNLDLDDDSMTIMQMPRDTFITLDGTPRKLNSVFGTFYNASSASNDEGRINDGMKGLAQTLASNLAINIDFYAYMNLEGFGAIVDAIGGVDMYVPFRMKYDDIYQNPPLHINLYEGQQTLDGDMAQQFVRFRASYVEGDLGRQDAQKLFMTAFMESFKNKISITNVVPVVTAILNNLEHSLSVSDAAYFVKEAMQMDFSNIAMFTAPNTPITYNRGSYVVIHRAAMYKIINENYNLFDTDIPETSFDKDLNFTLTTHNGVNSIYYSTEEFEGVLGADDIQQGGLDINHAW